VGWFGFALQRNQSYNSEKPFVPPADERKTFSKKARFSENMCF